MDDTSTKTRWLTAEEMRIWRGFIEATGRITAQINEGLKQHAGLTLDDYEVLVHLTESEDQRLRMTELSDRLLHSQSRLTQRVNRLVERGLVSREKCTEDGRVTYTCVTPLGHETIKRVAPEHLDDVRRVLIDRIKPEEKAMIADILERLACAARDDDQQ